MKLKSIAIIPDGNRRFASKQGLGFENAYLQGFRNVEKVMDWAKKADIKSVTFWALSLENYNKRSQIELKILFSLMKRKLRQVISDRTFEGNKIRVKFFGKMELLPEDLQKLIAKLMENTQKFDRTLSIAVAYSGREEIMNAARKLAIDFSGKGKKLGEMTEKDFEKYLYTPNAPDLIIRTGSVSRLSGFLPWQTAYSELYFSKKLWPEFSESDFDSAIDFYQETQRRFGK